MAHQAVHLESHDAAPPWTGFLLRCAGVPLRAGVPCRVGAPFRGPLRQVQRPPQIVEQVAGVLQADREPHRPLRDPGPRQRLGVHPVVGGARGVDDEGFRVTDVREVGEHPQRLYERPACVPSAFELEAEHRPAAARQQLLRERVVRVPGQLRVHHVRHRVVAVQELHHLAGVGHVPAPCAATGSPPLAGCGTRWSGSCMPRSRARLPCARA